ncbi:MAG: chemotaxis response regulator protein-glutamate methylesterase [Alteromonadaceae bacterium]|nr:MAG: chemotaxis response regulator protein-glutamate methylesterase [Alteromonadaceae bacterium]
MAESVLTVLVVDDSVLFRKILSDVLGELDGVEVIGTASSGDIGLKKSQQLLPDVITLDVEMPGMDGLEVLQHLQQTSPDIIVVMISSVTRRGAKCTIQALENGALDFIEKAQFDNLEDNIRHLQGQLKRIFTVVTNKKLMGAPSVGTAVRADRVQKKFEEQKNTKIDLIVIGVSTGGPQALPVLFKSLSTEINVPILIVQHMPPLFIQELVDSLNRKTEFEVVSAESYQELKPNHVYIAPGGTQMKLIKLPHAEAPCILITDDEPENFCKPSVDYMFRSVSDYYGDNILALIMTGMGADGVLGLKKLKDKNATVFAQDEASSVVYGMAMSAVKAGVVDQIIPLEDLSQAIESRVNAHSVDRPKRC